MDAGQGDVDHARRLAEHPQLYLRSLTTLGGATKQRTELESKSRSQDELEVAVVIIAAKRDSAVAHKAAKHGARAPLAPISDEPSPRPSAFVSGP